jgi:hypothetical protein
MTITTHSPLSLPLVCTNASCLEATSHLEECECACEGVDHGHVWKPALAAAVARLRTRTARDPFLGAAGAASVEDRKDREFGLGVRVASPVHVHLSADEMPF